MSDEENMDIIPDGDNMDISEDTPSDNPTTTAYCSQEDVNSLFGNISDEVPDETFTTSINNSTAWVNANLNRANVPIPLIDGVVGINPTLNPLVKHGDINTLKTAAIYYSASDIYMSLHSGEDYRQVVDMWYRKAQEFLDIYVEAYWNAEADEEDKLAHNVIGHHQVLSYNQRRNRRRHL